MEVEFKLTEKELLVLVGPAINRSFVDFRKDRHIIEETISAKLGFVFQACHIDIATPSDPSLDIEFTIRFYSPKSQRYERPVLNIN